LPTVAGGLVGAFAAAQVHFHSVAEASFGIGVLCWALLGSLVLNRLFFRPRLAGALFPTMAIEVAPPAVAGIAYFAITGGATGPVAEALAGPVVGLADGIGDEEAAALQAHARLVERVQHAADNGSPNASLGASTLARLLGDGEGMPVDLGRLEIRADAERDRLRARLAEECERLSPGAKPADLIRQLVRDHPDDEGIYAEARSLIDEATAFTLEHDLLPELGGE